MDDSEGVARETTPPLLGQGGSYGEQQGGARETTPRNPTLRTRGEGEEGRGVAFETTPAVGDSEGVARETTPLPPLRGQGGSTRGARAKPPGEILPFECWERVERAGG